MRARALNPILHLSRAELLHIVRDRTTMAQVLAMPLIQLLVLVHAATFVVRDTPLFVVDQDRSIASRDVIRRFAASGSFRILGISPSNQPAEEKLLSGEALMVLTLPRGFEKDLVREGRAPAQVVLNAEKGSAATLANAHAARILASYAKEAPPIEVRQQGWFNPALDYKLYMVPGVLVALVTLITTLLAAQNIAREKELGTLEQLNVTPITRTQFIAGKLLPLWVLGLVDLALGLLAGVLAFDLPIRGSLPLLFGAASVYLILTLSIGLLISTLVETQQQAMFVTFFIMSAYLLLSGLFTPLDSMADWVKTVSLVNPVRHFVAIARAILLRGAGPAEIAQPMGILTVFAALMLMIAVRRYRKTTG